MDITLIPSGPVRYDEKLDREVISDDGIVQLSDCSMVLLHKSGLRPLYLFEGKNERILLNPGHKKMAMPDLILYSDTTSGKQSAKVIQEQLLNVGCQVKMASASFLSKNIKQFNNIFLTRTKNLEEKGIKHIVIISGENCLNRISSCITGKELNPSYNIPIFSYSDGKEIQDINLSQNLYITREILDNCLLRMLSGEDNENFLPFRSKCKRPLDLYWLKRKLNIIEKN